MRVATYDNVRIRDIQEQLLTTEQIKTDIEQAEEDLARNRQKN